MMTAEVPEGIRGARPIDRGDYVLWVVQGEAYARNRNPLIEVASGIHTQVFHRPLEQARQIVGREIVEVPHTPPTNRRQAVESQGVAILFTTSNEPNIVIGYLTGRELLINTANYGDIPLAYFTRAILKEHRDKKLGRFALQQFLVIAEEVKMAGMRTQNPISVQSTAQSRIFGDKENGEPKRGFPFDKLYSEDHLAQEVMTGTFYRVRRNGSFPHPDFGVSIGDLPGENPTYDPGEDNAATRQIRVEMQGKFKMRFPRGDSMIVLDYVVDKDTLVQQAA